MSPLNVLRTALRGLAGGKLRAGLTTLGIIIGVASVIAVLALGNGARAAVESSFRLLGSDNVRITVKRKIDEGELVAVGEILSYEDGLLMPEQVELVDRVVTEEVAAGAQILPSAVSNTAGDGLAFKVEPGMRGLSVNVNEVVTAGGNIKPGDHVDMVAIFQLETVEAANHLLAQLGTPYSVTEPPVAPADADETERPRIFVLTVTLIQNVKVLGLAQTLTPTTAGGTFAEEVDETIAEPQASTATVEVTPDNAQMLTTADEYGVIRFDVRAPGDESIVEVQPTFIVVD